MRGRVRKRGNTWAIVFTEGYEEVFEDGKKKRRRRQKWQGGFRTRTEAQNHLTETLGAINKRSYVTPSKLMLIDYLEGEWLPALEASGELAPLTITTYKTIVKTRIKAKPWLAGLPLQQVTSGHVKRLLGELKKDGLSEPSCNMTRARSAAPSPTRSRIGNWRPTRLRSASAGAGERALARARGRA